MSQMTQRIDELQQQLDDRDLQLQEFKDDMGQYQTLGHLKNHLALITEQLGTKTCEVLESHMEM